MPHNYVGNGDPNLDLSVCRCGSMLGIVYQKGELKGRKFV